MNTTSEPGSSAEWRLTFVVNGQAGTWSRDDVRDNSTYAVNQEFPNIPIGPRGMISIQASGFEHDTTSANDTLPLLQVTTNPAEDFLLGGTRWSNLAQSDEGSYMIEYTIRPAIQQGLTVAREFTAIFEERSPLFRDVMHIPRVGRQFNRRNFQRQVIPQLQNRQQIFSGEWEQFIQQWQVLSNQGMRLARIASFRQDTGVISFGDTTHRLFLGTFEPGSGAFAFWVSPWETFEAKWKELSNDNMRLVDIATYTEGNETMYAGVYQAGTDPFALWVSDWPTFEAKWKELSANGLRLVAIDTFVENGQRRFAGVFRGGSDDFALWVGTDWAGFQMKVDEFAAKGLQLIDLAAYVEGSDQRFAGVFRASTPKHRIFKGDYAALEAETNRVSGSGGRLIGVDTFQAGSEG